MRRSPIRLSLPRCDAYHYNPAPGLGTPNSRLLDNPAPGPGTPNSRLLVERPVHTCGELLGLENPSSAEYDELESVPDVEQDPLELDGGDPCVVRWAKDLFLSCCSPLRCAICFAATTSVFLLGYFLIKRLVFSYALQPVPPTPQQGACIDTVLNGTYKGIYNITLWRTEVCEESKMSFRARDHRLNVTASGTANLNCVDMEYQLNWETCRVLQSNIQCINNNLAKIDTQMKSIQYYPIYDEIAFNFVWRGLMDGRIVLKNQTTPIENSTIPKVSKDSGEFEENRIELLDLL